MHCLANPTEIMNNCDNLLTNKVITYLATNEQSLTSDPQAGAAIGFIFHEDKGWKRTKLTFLTPVMNKECLHIGVDSVEVHWCSDINL